ncbi:MAG TPA: GNAT family N-acetyltransferase [Jatrophihabitans sp.]|nr:GNAT family N-acetyltransferase [Jatrophihabitans sp.]
MNIETARLVLRPITADDVAAVIGNRRTGSWADDFPAAGDVVVAKLLGRVGITHADARYGHRLIVERSSAQLIGGIGFFGAPTDGAIELGYGVVPSRRRRGYATEAAGAMVAAAFTRGDVEVVRAQVDLDNPASVLVLEKIGMTRCADTGAQATYEIRRAFA